MGSVAVLIENVIPSGLLHGGMGSIGLDGSGFVGQTADVTCRKTVAVINLGKSVACTIWNPPWPGGSAAAVWHGLQVSLNVWNKSDASTTFAAAAAGAGLPLAVAGAVIATKRAGNGSARA